MKFPRFPKKHTAYTYLRTPEYRSIPKLRLLNILVIGVMMAVSGATVFFLYQSVYTVVGQIEAITALQLNVAFEVMNFDRLEKVQTAWDKKHEHRDLTIARDPFAPPTSTTPGIPSHSFKTGCPEGPCGSGQ